MVEDMAVRELSEGDCTAENSKVEDESIQKLVGLKKVKESNRCEEMW